MNAARRKRLDAALDIIRECAEEERAAFDNLPESIQDSERGARIEEAADALEQIISDLEEITMAG